MFELDIEEEESYEQAAIETIKIFETPLDLLEARMSLLADLKDFNSNTLTTCRKTIEKGINLAKNGKFDQDKLTKGMEYFEKQYGLIECTTKDGNILAQIERLYDDLEIIYKESKKAQLF